ncbi:Phosphoserine phosphatase (PSP) (PSPase) (O-phosphoserine phosphohydrolase) [Durusdinium trenchii]|uniref:phosphoserine phosphatase n=2 Tax=Durusdinium trenchii TaxID=1381693 RepID=A0ABP0QZX5_9DINO
MVDRADGIFLFRLHKERVFYMSERLLKHAGHIPKKELLSAGVCIGKFTHSRKFRLQITALDYLARLAQYRVWLKPSGEQHFVYGNHVVKVESPGGVRLRIFAGGNILVFRGWGADKPGICQAFLKLVVEHQSEVLDMAQFLLGGGLMFTFVLKVAEQSSIGLMKSLSSCAREQGLQLNFHFPDAGQVPEAEGGNEAVLALVSSEAITPALIMDVDKVLWGHGCVVLEIEHRSDNMKEHNGDYNKVQIRIRCPIGLRLATLMMGPPAANIEGLQKVCWKHGAEVTSRWWDAMNRPNGKSLVVFGLSHVLCKEDVMDLVLREAGLPTDAGTRRGNTTCAPEEKLAMLKGKSTSLLRKVIEHLPLTPGAKVVCGAMKRLGCRLAILTNTGLREIAEHVKSQLGFDYVICRDVEEADGCFTGRYLGELSDVKFRKTDLLKLMAEREGNGVRCQNVITVGEPLKGLKAANARLMLETFGPTVYFNSVKLKDLTIVLYLLGFSGSDVRALRKRRWDNGPGEAKTTSSVEAPPSSKRFMLQVSAQQRTAGQLQSIFQPLAPQGSNVQLTTIRQCSLQDGGMCLGMDLTVLKDGRSQATRAGTGIGLPIRFRHSRETLVETLGSRNTKMLREENEQPDVVVKDLIFACQKVGLTIMDVNDSAKDFNWKTRYANRYVLTMVQKPNISSTSLSEVLGAIGSNGINIIKIERLSTRDIASLQFTVSLPDDLSSDDFASKMVEVSKKHGADIAIQRDDLERWMRRLVVFDMDSTLIQQEVIDELAKLAGVETQVKEITEAAMRGELDFFGSLKSRVALLKGHNAEELFAKVKANLIFTPGAKKLCTCLKRLGFKTAVISGGFLPVAQEVQRYLGLDYAFANTLEVDETTGLLTGQTSGPVVTPQRKRQLLATIANVEGCEIQQTIAVGDGANDIPMLHAAGLGIAFCAKPKVQEVSRYRINQMDLSTVLFLIGISERAMERLADETPCGM